jgi:hypothetical protein
MELRRRCDCVWASCRSLPSGSRPAGLLQVLFPWPAKVGGEAGLHTDDGRGRGEQSVHRRFNDLQ